MYKDAGGYKDAQLTSPQRLCVTQLNLNIAPIFFSCRHNECSG